MSRVYAGAQPRLKSWREPKVYVQTPWRLCPAPGQRPGWVLGAGGGRPFPLWGSGSITLRKFLKTQMLNPCILVTTCCEISCFLKTTAVSWGDQYIVGAPNLKVGGPVSSGPYGCCAYKFMYKQRYTQVFVMLKPIAHQSLTWCLPHTCIGLHSKYVWMLRFILCRLYGMLNYWLRNAFPFSL